MNNLHHNLSNTRFYKIFSSMRYRCKALHYYTEKNIRLEWKNFEEFKNDMYDDYKKHVEEYGEKQTTIDRIDNNGNYKKSNCRWATYKEQFDNKRKNQPRILPEFNGRKQSIKEWAKEFNMSEILLRGRIKANWSYDRIINNTRYNKRGKINYCFNKEHEHTLAIDDTCKLKINFRIKK